MKRVFIAMITLLAIGNVPRARAQVDLSSGLIACWDMEESSGIRVDVINGFDLTDNNTVGSVSGLYGNAASFVLGNNEFLSYPDDSLLSIVNGGTFYAIVDPEPASFGPVLSKSEGPGFADMEYALFVENGLWVLGNGVGYDLVNNLTALTPEWNHVVAYYNGVDEAGLIINNTVFTQSTLNGTIDGPASFSIGYNEVLDWYYQGYIDTVAMWDRAISIEEADWLYNGGAGRECAEMGAVGTGATVHEVELPSGGVGELVMSITAGESLIILALAINTMIVFYDLLSRLARSTKVK